ncbi:Glucan 1,3-beta-glucosidase [Ceratobasidium theobromae]|uniref:Glucan 1,3-beta-glucosidase n=1 Tax=Ceratobasidium theobromae TaxID=1582974 RepID=A0A5N5QDU2_9AGAM|nr:Glucan 1,3-beta-glucosidase [Ceratobasidium theobromae]
MVPFFKLALSLFVFAPTVFGELENNSRAYNHAHVARAQKVRAPDAAVNITTEHTKRASLRFPYGQTKVQGVNLGGWLVLEAWITPSIFENTGNPAIVDEYTFCQYQDYNIAHSKLEGHWSTWITETDFASIAAAGLNHVRIPVPHWAFDIADGEPYHNGQYPYLLKAVQWARNHGLKVLIDLHTAPGGQNPFDNSGRRGVMTWHTNPHYVARTNAIIKTLAADKPEYADTVTSIAPLNEPAGFYGNDVLNVVTQYWYDSYGNIRYPYGTSTQGPLVEVIHDAFQNLTYWNGFMHYPNFEGVMMDTHHYQVFTQDTIALTWPEHIKAACDFGSTKLGPYSASNLWTIVGEWTTSPTDCAKYLNGRDIGARYDGTYPGSTKLGECGPFTGARDHFSPEFKAFMREYYEAQVTAFERNGAGWFYWTWKSESADEWSYQAGLAGGWIPSNPNDRIHPNICG